MHLCLLKFQCLYVHQKRIRHLLLVLITPLLATSLHPILLNKCLLTSLLKFITMLVVACLIPSEVSSAKLASRLLHLS